MVDQAVILVGGQGTRLRPLTSLTPKPVLDVVDRPFLVHMLDWLARHGIRRAVLACGFRSEVVVEKLGDRSPSGVELTYVHEPEPLGTAGALKFCEEHLDERFLMLNGDVLTDLDLTAQLAFHEAQGATGTLGLVPVEDPSAFGLVRLQDDGSVRGFVEKPKPEEIDTDLISAGCYVLERSVLQLIPAGRAVSIEREVFPRLVSNGLYGFAHRGAYFMDLGTPERYLDGVRDVLTGTLTTETYALLDGRGVRVDPSAAVGAATIPGPAWIGADASIGDDVTIGPGSVIASGASIGDRAVIDGSVVLAGAQVGEGAELRRALIGAGASVGAAATIGEFAVVGPGANVDPGTVVEPATKIEATEEAGDVAAH